MCRAELFDKLGLTSLAKRERGEILGSDVNDIEHFFDFCKDNLRVPSRSFEKRKLGIQDKFKLYDFQKRVIREFNTKRHCILKKFRMGGFTSLALAWAIWKCVHHEEFKVTIIADFRPSIIYDQCKKLMRNSRIYHTYFPSGAAGAIRFGKSCIKILHPSEIYRDRLAVQYRDNNCVIIDEAAYIRNMPSVWEKMNTCSPPNASCKYFVISTPNNSSYGNGKWFKDKWCKDSFLSRIFVTYNEHPEYDKEWTAKMKMQLGDKGFRQEVIQEFI